MLQDLNYITSKLMNLEKPKKPKMLVVDDEPDNLDLLYRTFRRDYNVFRAESGVQALEVLAKEGEVAVIISDQRMPEMKGTEFLSKTVPQFPDTIRIILTGFTDVEDLVDAINSGQVYKYITKPWEPNELKIVVQRAADTYIILKQRTEELQKSQSQTQLLSEILQIGQKEENVTDIVSKIPHIFTQILNVDNCILQLVKGDELDNIQGVSSASLTNWLQDDSLAKEAIAHQKMQVWTTNSDKIISDAEKYQKADIQVHLVIPIIYRGKVLAVLSLQWHHLGQFTEDDLKFLYLSGQEIGLIVNG
ncbi:MAG TPA: response regulator [Allocoleopsis sp.]